MNLYLDFETRSRVDLRRVGAHRYFEDPSTEVLCAGWALNDGGLMEWTPEADRPDPLPLGTMRPSLSDWRLHVENPAVLIVAHNAEFERLALRHKFGSNLPPSRFRCTAAQAAAAGLPRSLDAATAALGLEHRKDPRGKRLIQKLSRPRRSGEFWGREDAAEDFEALGEYNIYDVAACRALHLALPPLSATEQALWELTVTINDRGLAMDGGRAALLEVLVDEEVARLEARWVELTGAPPRGPRAAAAVGMASLAKAEVRRALRRSDLDLRVREALQVRQRLARSSVRKLVAFRERTSADGRLRGQLVYAGAERTGRWSGSGVQLQNLPRGLGEETDAGFDALELGVVPLLWDDPMRFASDALKGLLVGPFLVGDWAQIEARVLLWLAGARERLEEFARGDDVYSAMASAIYGHPVRKGDRDEALNVEKRQLGKVAVLGCGYGLGWRKLQEQLEDVFDVLVDEETARRVVDAYRDRYREVPRLWRTLEALVRAGMRGPVRWHGLWAGRYQDWLRLALSSGRALYYREPQLNAETGEFSYLGRNQYAGGRWERVTTYGGKLVENVVQAVSRDVMAHSMLALERAGFRLVLMVHDEVVVEAPPERLAEFRAVLAEPPPWAPGLPLAVDCFATRRYRK